MGAKHSLEDDLITFKLTSKQMLRSSQKCKKNEAAANAKALKAMKDVCDAHQAYSMILKIVLRYYLLFRTG